MFSAAATAGLRPALHCPALISGLACSGLDFTLNVAPQLGKDDRVVAISMSGNVDRTLEGAQIAQGCGARLSVLTNGLGGRLGALGGTSHSLDIPDIAPFLCGTSSYTATLATLQLAFDHLDGSLLFGEGFGALIDALPGFIERADSFTRGLAVEIGGTCAGARFLGVGASTATADYGAAKFVEVTSIPAWSDDIEEFAHRQYWGMQTSEIVILLPVDEASARYAEASADALSDLGVATVSLEPAHSQVPSARFRLQLPGDRLMAGLTQAIVLQLLAYYMGIASGTDPNTRGHLKDDQARFSVSRKLTRRSLLGTGQ